VGFLKRLFNPVYGLIEGNVQVYFRCRAAGYDHQSSLQRMIGTRYSPIRNEVAQSFLLGKLAKMSNSPSADDIKRIIHYMFTFECVRRELVTMHVTAFDGLDKEIERSGQKHPKFPMPYSGFIAEQCEGASESTGGASAHPQSWFKFWFRFFDDLNKVIGEYRRKHPKVDMTD